MLSKLVELGWKANEYGLNKRDNGVYWFTDCTSIMFMIKDDNLKAFKIKDGKVIVNKRDRDLFDFFKEDEVNIYE